MGTITIAAAAAVKIRELWQHALNQRGGEARVREQGIRVFGGCAAEHFSAYSSSMKSAGSSRGLHS